MERNRLKSAICACFAAGALGSVGALAHETGDADQSNTGTATGASGTHTTSGTDATSAQPVGSSGAATMAPGTTAVSPSPHDRTTTSEYDPRTFTDSATTDSDQSRSGNPRNTAGAGSGPDAVVWYVFPASLESQNNRAANDCWVKLYSGDNFKGRSIYIVGPANLSELQSPYGTGMNNWESAEVGRNATVMTYDDQNFGSRNATLNSGQRYPDLDDSKLGLFDDIESLKVTCRNSSGSTSTN